MQGMLQMLPMSPGTYRRIAALQQSYSSWGSSRPTVNIDQSTQLTHCRSGNDDACASAGGSANDLVVAIRLTPRNEVTSSHFFPGLV